jgi:Fic family protein
MTELIDALNATSDLPALARAAMAHLNLVMIHPFSDGNGRMARALQTLVLAREGILDPRFSSIEEYLGRNTLDYYRTLAEVGRGSWHPERDPLPWLRFCLTAHYRQAETLLRRSKEIEHLAVVLEPEIAKRGLNERTIYALLDAAIGHRVRNATYRKIAEISDEVAGKDLRALVAQGLLVPQGEKRGRSYVAGSWLIGTRNNISEVRVTTDPFTNTKKTRPPAGQQSLPGLAARDD